MNKLFLIKKEATCPVEKYMVCKNKLDVIIFFFCFTFSMCIYIHFTATMHRIIKLKSAVKPTYCNYQYEILDVEVTFIGLLPLNL